MAEIESWGYYKQLYANKMDNLEEVEKFSERYNFLILNWEELENINITHKQWIWNYNQVFQHTKVQDQVVSQVNSIKHLEKS